MDSNVYTNQFYLSQNIHESVDFDSSSGLYCFNNNHTNGNGNGNEGHQRQTQSQSFSHQPQPVGTSSSISPAEWNTADFPKASHLQSTAQSTVSQVPTSTSSNPSRAPCPEALDARTRMQKQWQQELSSRDDDGEDRDSKQRARADERTGPNDKLDILKVKRNKVSYSPGPNDKRSR
ncbi:hypothetical protein PQX77_016160 [Marasmius sp. AFHP31]|nr:hypothetical protein PQX77_016160 [Marasmius sp. AFHP31]